MLLYRYSLYNCFINIIFKQFNIINSNDILNWDKIIESNGLYINIQPMELNDFDWDLYHSGDEEINNIFEEIYENIKDKYG